MNRAALLGPALAMLLASPAGAQAPQPVRVWDRPRVHADGLEPFLTAGPLAGRSSAVRERCTR